MNKCWFDYKTVILSGASSGIGKGIAERLIKDHGCKVIGIARNEQRLINFKEELGNKGDNFSYYTFDVSQEEKWQEELRTATMRRQWQRKAFFTSRWETSLVMKKVLTPKQQT